MTRTQRKAHAVIWLVLGPLLLAAIGHALSRRAEPADRLPGVEEAR